MKRSVRITGVKKKEIDEEKLALAFLLLARSMQNNAGQTAAGARDSSVDESDED